MKNTKNRQQIIDSVVHGFTFNKIQDEDCLGCKFEGLCKAPGVWESTCPLGEEFSDEKDTILLIDDNTSIIEFLKEDVDCIGKAGAINLDNYNIISFTNSRCAFQFYSFQQKRQGLNIKYAIIDLEYNGAIVQDNKTIKMNGIDVYESILKYNPGVKVLFYTNKLNQNIKSHKAMIEQYNKLTGRDIQEVILDKTFTGIKTRRQAIAKDLFNSPLRRCNDECFVK